MPHYDQLDANVLVEECRRKLGLSQGELAVVAGASKRTVSRWSTGTSTPAPVYLIPVARAVYPLDRDLAAAMAARADTTLLREGIELPAPPPPPPPPAPPPPLTAPVETARAPASTEHLVDSVLCAAAIAASSSPQAIRPAVAAAFERVIALGLTPGEVHGVLAPPAPKRTKGGAL